MPGIVDDVHNMLLAHEDIAQERTLMVLRYLWRQHAGLLCLHFYQNDRLGHVPQSQTRCAVKIADVVAAHGAEFAFPTQTLQLETPEALAQMAQAQGERREQTAKLSSDV